MTEPEELDVPDVADVPEPDQEPHEPIPDEADDHDDEEENDEEERLATPDELPEAHGPTQEEWEKRFRDVEKRFGTYTATVTKIWEEDAVHLMPFQLDVAAPPGFIDIRNKGRVDDETKAAVLAFLGFDGETDMRDDPYSDVCATCDGWGVVKTGSRVPNQDVRNCLDCKGLGFQPKDTPVMARLGNGLVADTSESGMLVPAASGPESPEIEALRLRGYTIVPPMQTSG